MGHYNMKMTVVWELQQLRGILGTLQTTTPLMHFWVDHVLSDLGTLLVGGHLYQCMVLLATNYETGFCCPEPDIRWF